MDVSLEPDDVAYAGVLGRRELLRHGRLTATELLELSLARIARLDGQLRAFRTVLTDSARAEAAAADAALAAGDARPLLGVPVAVKDNVAVAGVAPSMGTGSPQPVEAQDAELVRRLRAAGAVVVGTTNLPELALWPFTESATWGVTRNPWSPGHTSGGSSGGSATAVAAGMVAAATASDGGGSIRVPAACTHLVGLKPQRGRVPLGPTTAEVEHWQGLSSAGVLTRTVADQALVLSVLAGTPLAATEPGRLRIAWSTRGAVPTGLSPAQRGALQGTLTVLWGLGHEVFEADPDLSAVQASFLARYLVGVAEDLAGLADPARTELRTRAVAAVGRRLPRTLLTRALLAGERAAVRLAALPAGADVLVTPVLPGPPQRVRAHHGLATVATAGRVVPYTVAWNVTGQPAMSVPAGLTRDGLPLAVQLIARPGEEELLLGLAAQLERATDFPLRRPPLR